MAEKNLRDAVQMTSPHVTMIPLSRCLSTAWPEFESGPRRVAAVRMVPTPIDPPIGKGMSPSQIIDLPLSSGPLVTCKRRSVAL